MKASLKTLISLTIRARTGWAGLNFAFAKDLIDYHAMTESSENLDKNSLAQQAYYALSAARHFAKATSRGCCLVLA